VELPKNILIVEDEMMTQRYMQDILKAQNVNVVACVDNATDAIDAIQENECDMVLMDINIKGSIDGLQLARKILDNHVLAIIFVTAYTDDETLEEALDVNPYMIISKPFTEKNLLVSMRVAYKRFTVYEKAQQYNAPKADKLSHTIKINKAFAFSNESETLFYNNEPIRLSLKQRKLLGTLVKHINMTVSYDTLIYSIWGEETATYNSLRTLVYTLRKQFSELPIESHSKVGYSLYST